MGTVKSSKADQFPTNGFNGIEKAWELEYKQLLEIFILEEIYLLLRKLLRDSIVIESRHVYPSQLGSCISMRSASPAWLRMLRGRTLAFTRVDVYML